MSRTGQFQAPKSSPVLHVSSISVQIFGCMCVVMASLFVLNLAHEQCEGGAADSGAGTRSGF